MNCCPRCNREVFFAERKVALGRVWHSFCFSCYKCRKLLDACSVHTYCDELFCTACFNSICDPCKPCSPCKPPCSPCKPPCSPCKPPRCSSPTPCCRYKPCPAYCPPCNDPCCPPCSDPCCDPCCDPCADCFRCKPPVQKCKLACRALKVCCSADSVPCRLPPCCKTCPNPCDPCCIGCPPLPCGRDVCDPCTRVLPCKPCCDPFCNCCGKRTCTIRCAPTEHYSLRPTVPKERCEPSFPCLMCDSGPPRVPPCCAQKAGSACAAPTPRETKNYYSRNHKKQFDSTGCKGSCYCPGDCCCPHKGFEGRFADPKSCDPCAIMDCCPNECGCCKPRPPKCCSPSRRPCTKPPKCCTDMCCDPCKCKPPKRSGCCSPCRSRSPCPKPDPCCAPCCPPYQPPCRKPICYPPVKCCENDCESPLERICYYPCPTPPQPKYCSCGSPNPCDCDLNAKRRQAICEMSPCCRRCGRKVYAAEQIMASGGAFHSSCFSCYSCHKPLEVTNVYENQGEIYCKQCYAKYFGMQGYGYGSTLLSPL